MHQLQLTATISFDVKLSFDWNDLPQFAHFPFCERRCTQWWRVFVCSRYWRTPTSRKLDLQAKFRLTAHTAWATTRQAAHFIRGPCFWNFELGFWLSGNGNSPHEFPEFEDNTQVVIYRWRILRSIVQCSIYGNEILARLSCVGGLLLLRAALSDTKHKYIRW